MDSLSSQSVAIDGLSVRRIREEKRLTQLYVAKVVGVTTDTVSRWENNRYPTIRRDNALKLAEALEVELDALLKRERPEAAVLEPGIRRGKKFGTGFYALVAILAIVLIAAVALLWRQYTRSAVPSVQAVRIVPHFAAPRSAVLVQVRINRTQPLKGMILKEKFPPGWRLLDSVPVASSVDVDAAGARWIFRNPAPTVNLYYLLLVAEGAADATPPLISGEIIANPDGRRSSVALTSPEQMQIGPLHWADSNGNSVIDDLEILEVSDLAEKVAALDLQWDLIESLWEAEHYRWSEEQRQFVPLSPSDQ